jgi:hypothetical protein
MLLQQVHPTSGPGVERSQEVESDSLGGGGKMPGGQKEEAKWDGGREIR